MTLHPSLLNVAFNVFRTLRDRNAITGTKNGIAWQIETIGGERVLCAFISGKTTIADVEKFLLGKTLNEPLIAKIVRREVRRALRRELSNSGFTKEASK